MNPDRLIYLDYFSEMFDGNDGLIEEYGADSVHPNKSGYLIMSQLAQKAISKTLTFNHSLDFCAR